MFTFPSEYEWLPPWIKLPADYATVRQCVDDDPATVLHGSNGIVSELRREMPPGHPLYSAELTVLAVNVEYGHHDYLFTTDLQNAPIALVHLTWSVESNPEWPSTQLFEDLAAWTERMKLDYEHAGVPSLQCGSKHYKQITRFVDGTMLWICSRCGKPHDEIIAEKRG